MLFKSQLYTIHDVIFLVICSFNEYIVSTSLVPNMALSARGRSGSKNDKPATPTYSFKY